MGGGHPSGPADLPEDDSKGGLLTLANNYVTPETPLNPVRSKVRLPRVPSTQAGTTTSGVRRAIPGVSSSGRTSERVQEPNLVREMALMGARLHAVAATRAASRRFGSIGPGSRTHQEGQAVEFIGPGKPVT